MARGGSSKGRSRSPSPRSSGRKTSTPTRSAPTRSSVPARRPEARPSPKAAPARPASTATKPTAPQPPPGAHPHPPPTPMAPSSGNSMMKSIGASMAGSLMGNLAAHSLMNAFGGRGEEAERVQEMSKNPEESSRGACGPNFTSFNDCLSQNEQNIGSCQSAYDMLLQCNRGDASNDSGSKSY